MADKTVNIALKVEGKDAKKVISSIKKEFGTLDPKIDNTSKKFSKMGAVIGTAVAAVGIREVANLTSKVFELGSSVEETESKFVTSLGNQAEAGRAFLEEYSTLLGLTNTEAKNFLATQVNIAQGLGFTEKEAFDLSKEVVKLAGDLASFNNIPIERTLNAIQGGLTGEREALKSLGIVVREADVLERALLNTRKESAKELTEQEKSLASFQLITERAGAAVGDLDRTSESAANQARQLKAEIGDLADNLAVMFLPALAEGVSQLLAFTENVKFLLDTQKELNSELELSEKVNTSFVESMNAARLEIARTIEAENLDAQQLKELEAAYINVQKQISRRINSKEVEIEQLREQKNAEQEFLKTLLEGADNEAERNAVYETFGGKLTEVNTKLQAEEANLRNLYAALQDGNVPFAEFIKNNQEAAQGANDLANSFSGGGESSGSSEGLKNELSLRERIDQRTQDYLTSLGLVDDQLKSIDQLISEVDLDLGDPIDKTTEALNNQKNEVFELSNAYMMAAASAQDGIKGLIKSIINQAIATQVAKALSSVPFPLNIAVAGAAGIAVEKLLSNLIPGFADGVTGFGGGMALVGERGPEIVSLPQGSNVVTNQNTESILSSFARQSTQEAVSTIGSPNSGIIDAIREGFKEMEIPIKGSIKGRDIKLSYDKQKSRGDKYTVQI